MIPLRVMPQLCVLMLGTILLIPAVNYAGVSDDIPASSTGALKFYIDHAIFNKNEDGLYYCEFYLMFYAADLTDKKKVNSNVAEIKIDTNLENTLSNQEWTRQWSLDIQLSENDSLKKIMVVYDQWAELLPSANYKLIISAIDINGTAIGNTIYNFSIQEQTDNRPYISFIEFVSSISKSNERDRFFKNNQKIVPNPARRYGALAPVLYFYYEVYNLLRSEGDSLSIEYSIFSKKDTEYANYPKKYYKINGDAIGIAHSIDVSNLKTGMYRLNVQANTDRGNAILESSRLFEVIQRDIVIEETDFDSGLIEINSKMLTYLMTPAQKNIFESLGEQGKVNFILQIWQQKDPTPGTKENEYLQKVKTRFYYANSNFSWGIREGWKTDRGRVLIVYGMPAEIVQNISNTETAPYEIWIYREDRSYEFIFGDLNSTGNYVLLHSNVDNEVHNNQWQDLLRKM